MASNQTERTHRRTGGSSTSPVNLKVLKKVVTLMNRAQLTELDVEQEGIKIHLRKTPETGPAQVAPAAAPLVPSAAPAPGAAQAPAPPSEEPDLHVITSPMVGTFYHAPSPDASPYVREGSAVEEGTVVCIVEAMKLMNEIKAEVKGVIRSVLVENAQAVEFGQPLFKVERKA